MCYCWHCLSGQPATTAILSMTKNLICKLWIGKQKQYRACFVTTKPKSPFKPAEWNFYVHFIIISCSYIRSEQQFLIFAQCKAYLNFNPPAIQIALLSLCVSVCLSLTLGLSFSLSRCVCVPVFNAQPTGYTYLGYLALPKSPDVFNKEQHTITAHTRSDFQWMLRFSVVCIRVNCKRPMVKYELNRNEFKLKCDWIAFKH